LSSYQIVDVELSTVDWRSDESIATVATDEAGIAVIARYLSEPIGFEMLALSPGARVLPRDLCKALGHDVFTRAIAGRIRQELRCVPGSVPRDLSLTISICTKDRPARLSRCLDSLMRAWTHSGLPSDVEMLVVDNAPSDAQTRAVVAPREPVHYVKEPRPGLDFARNRAIDAARTELVAFVDDDVEVDLYWLDALRTTWKDYPTAGGVSGQVLPLKLDTEARILFERAGGFRRGFDTQLFSFDRVDPYQLYPCNTGDFGVGCNMSFRRDLLLELGGFDEALDTGPPLPGGGDHDILYRVVRSGKPLIYTPKCVVFHEHRETMEQLRRQYWSWGESTLAFAKKSLDQDVSMRPHWRRSIFLRFLHLALRWLKSLFGRGVLPPSACWSELAGGSVGFLGGYRRSSRRTDRINQEYAS
jgi:GT2 family glycosyltransferase